MYLDVSWLSVSDTCRIHAGYMRDTCSKNVSSRSMSDNCGYMQDTCKTCKIQGSSVYLGTADKIHARYMQDTCRIHVGYEDQVCILAQPFRYVADYARYVLKVCRICVGKGCVDVSRVGLEIWRQGGVRWRTNQASMYFILCVRYTQNTSGYIRIH